MKKKNVLITGSNGFVGSWLVNELKNNYKIIGCGRQNKSQSDTDKYVRWHIGYEEIPPELLESKIDVVIHAAANKSIDEEDLDLSYTNLIGTHRIMNLCRKQKCETAVLISGTTVIGEQSNQVAAETNAFNPQTLYHATKAAQELMFNQLGKYGVRVVNLRVPSPIAPEMTARTIFNIFIDRAMSNEDIIVNGRGSRRQNYLDVRDLAKAVDSIIKNPNITGTFNVGADKTISNLELAELCVQNCGSSSRIIHNGESATDDNQVWEIDSSLLKDAIGFGQSIPIEQTIREYIEVHK